MLKSFIEFEKLEDANLAMECLNEKNFNNVGKIRLYASKNHDLSMTNKFLCSKDFRGVNQQEYIKKIKARYDLIKSIAKENKPDFVKKMTGVENIQEHSTSKLSSPNLNKVNLLFLNFKIKATIFSILYIAIKFRKSNQKTSLDPKFKNESKNVSSWNVLPKDFSVNLTRNSINPIKQRQIPMLSRPRLGSIGTNNGSFQKTLSSRGGVNGMVKKNSYQENDIENIIRANLKLRSKVTQSKVVLISNLNCQEFGIENMYNLVSCTGNISKLLLMPNQNKCFIEFKNKEFSHTCMVLLNNQFFMGEKLKVNFSKYCKIDLKKNGKSNNSEKFNRVKKVARSEQRYFDKVSTNIIIAPTIFLFLRIRQNSKSEDQISHKQIFNCIKGGKYLPIQIKLIEGNSKNLVVEEFVKKGLLKNNKRKKELLLSVYKFKNLQESMFVLAYFHKFKIQGQYLRISFSYFKF